MRAFVLPRLAAAHRRRLEGVTFIGVTGSAGKTTTMRLIAAALSKNGAARASAANRYEGVTDAVLATNAEDGFAVVEVSAYPKGAMQDSLALVRPRIGVVTSVGLDHLKAFRSADGIAEEKAKLVRCLPTDGVAILNADDPRVLAMAKLAPCRVITYGTAADATLRAENIQATWPERLSFTAIHGDERLDVVTRLCGSHWVAAVLAALATASALGVPLQQAARAIAAIEPEHHRMYPVTTRDGITFILDDWKSAVWALPPVFAFMQAAAAPRKFIVIGTLSDYGGSSERVYKRTARAALEVAEQVIFVGPMSTLGLHGSDAANAGRIQAFGTIRAAADYLATLLRPGDLVLLKGAVNADHLGRLAHNWVEPISCWSVACRKNTRCSKCDELRADAGALAARRDRTEPAADLPEDKPKAPTGLPVFERPLRIVVGIGNPGAKYDNTPHNVGFEVVDELARRLGLAWTMHGDAALTHASLNGHTLVLVKPQSFVNKIGGTLKTLSDAIGFTAQDCVLIQDDANLPLGKLRTRLRGSDGGHKGVRSALVAFQTDEVPRLKIGVAPVAARLSMVEYLLSPFAPDAAEVMHAATGAAIDRLLQELTRTPTKPIQSNQSK